MGGFSLGKTGKNKSARGGDNIKTPPDLRGAGQEVHDYYTTKEIRESRAKN
jgi:hypothetical protein